MISCLVPGGNPHSGQGRSGWWWLKRGTTSDLRTPSTAFQPGRRGKRLEHACDASEDPWENSTGEQTYIGWERSKRTTASHPKGTNRSREGTKWLRQTTLRATTATVRASLPLASAPLRPPASWAIGGGDTDAAEKPAQSLYRSIRIDTLSPHTRAARHASAAKAFPRGGASGSPGERATMPERPTWPHTRPLKLDPHKRKNPQSLGEWPRVSRERCEIRAKHRDRSGQHRIRTCDLYGVNVAL